MGNEGRHLPLTAHVADIS